MTKSSKIRPLRQIALTIARLAASLFEGSRVLRTKTMGLKASEHGVKSIVKHMYASACRNYDTLGDVRKAVGADRSKTSITLDGYVLENQSTHT